MAYAGLEKKQDLSPVHYFLSGSLGGMVGWAAIFPLDVIKSRMQLGMLPAEMGMVQVLPTPATCTRALLPFRCACESLACRRQRQTDRTLLSSFAAVH